MTSIPLSNAEASSSPPPVARYPFAEHAIGLLPLAGLLIAVFLLPGGESDVARHFADIRSRMPGATALMEWLSKYGNLPFYLAYAGILLFAAGPDRREKRQFVLRYLLLLALLLLVADALKIWIGRPRPGVTGEYITLSLHKAWHSFPSNHMLETAFSLLALALHCRKYSVTLVCGFAMAAMGMTRLYLGRHHPTDLLGSVIIGSLWVYLLWRWHSQAGERSENLDRITP